MQAQMGTADTQEAAQRQALSKEEVKVITQELLNQAQAVQQQLYETEQVSADEGEAQGSSDLKRSVSEQPQWVLVPTGDFDSIDKIKQQIETIFTPEAAQEYYAELFHAEDPVFQEKDGKLYYQPDHLFTLQQSMEYQIDTSVVMRQTVDEITVEVTAETPGASPVKRNLRLKKEEGQWLLDSAIFF